MLNRDPVRTEADHWSSHSSQETTTSPLAPAVVEPEAGAAAEGETAATLLRVVIEVEEVQVIVKEDEVLEVVVVAQEADEEESEVGVEDEGSRTNLHQQHQTQHQRQATLNLSYPGPISFASQFSRQKYLLLVQYIIFKLPRSLFLT
jgi:hypothetical protein